VIDHGQGLPYASLHVANLSLDLVVEVLNPSLVVVTIVNKPQRHRKRRDESVENEKYKRSIPVECKKSLQSPTTPAQCPHNLPSSAGSHTKPSAVKFAKDPQKFVKRFVRVTYENSRVFANAFYLSGFANFFTACTGDITRPYMLVV
jgi:hypothetical protein